MKSLAVVTLCAALSAVAPTAFADNNQNQCRNVTGKGTWTLIPAPNDPLGRVLGQNTGTLKSAMSAYLTSLVPQPSGAFNAGSVEVWQIGANDLLVFDGQAVFTPVAGQPVGTVSDSLILTVHSGTGAFANATGTIKVVGTGHNLFGPNAAPGATFFEVTYQGNICGIKPGSNVGNDDDDDHGNGHGH